MLPPTLRKTIAASIIQDQISAEHPFSALIVPPLAKALNIPHARPEVVDKVLADDQHAFPPYQVSIAVSQDRLRETPGMREALQELSGRFTNQTMQQLNYQVDGEHRPVSQVAAEFLKEMYGTTYGK